MCSASYLSATRGSRYISLSGGEKKTEKSFDHWVEESVRSSGRKDSGGVAIERSLRAMIRENSLGESHLGGGAARHISNDIQATTTATITARKKGETRLPRTSVSHNRPFWVHWSIVLLSLSPFRSLIVRY